MGEGRAKERHDPIAHDLVHRALVAVDRLHHELEDGIENLPCLLGITIGEQLHRPFEVGEEHGDLLALAFQGALRGQDLLGQMFRRVGLRGADLRRRDRRRREQRRAASTAELLAGLVREHAGGAGARERRPAFCTEAAALAVLGPAARAKHQPSALISVSACPSQNRMSISRYIVVAALRCSWARWRSLVRPVELAKAEVEGSRRTTLGPASTCGQG
jgi:hypothetical protein